MFEKYLFKTYEQRKKEQALHQEETAEVITEQEEKIRQELAVEIRKPFQHSFLKKFERIIGAFVLAGMITLTPKEGWTPTVSKERLALAYIEHNYSGQEREKALQVVLEAIREKGGIQESPQFPEYIVKYKNLNKEAYLNFHRANDPYFSKAEIILGQDFVQNNSEKAAEYMDRIKKTQSATVMINAATGDGSGVLVETPKGPIILTNAHVVEDSDTVFVTFFNKTTWALDVISIDEERDLALVDFSRVIKVVKERQMAEKFETLVVASHEEFNKQKKGQALAMIGHPLGYPFEVSIGKYVSIFNISEKEKEKIAHELKSELMLTKPDKRFEQLAAYVISHGIDREIKGSKGVTIAGMSGGPIVNLDSDELRIMGINCLGSGKRSLGITANEIRHYLQEKGYLEKAD